jgi:hypothetical protein
MFQQIIDLVSKYFYSPHWPIVGPSYKVSTPILTGIYIIFAFCLFGFFLKTLFKKEKLNSKSLLSLFSVTIAVVLAGQTLSLLFLDVNFMADKFAGKTVDTVYSENLGAVYNLAKASKRLIQPTAHAELITDLDLRQDPGMIYHRALSYFLYPIDLRGIRAKPADTLIIFLKKDPHLFVKEGFSVKEQLSPKTIIAIKENDRSVKTDF